MSLPHNHKITISLNKGNISDLIVTNSHRNETSEKQENFNSPTSHFRMAPQWSHAARPLL